MKRTIIYIIIFFIFLSCNDTNKSIKTNNLKGNDYDLFKNTPVWELSKFVKEEDTLNIVKEVKKSKLNIDFQEPKFGNTLLMLAINNSQYNSVKTLLKLGADPNKPDMYNGETSVIYAANNNDPKFLQLLLEYNGNPNAIEIGKSKDNDDVKITALLASINPLDSNSLRKVELLVEKGADINYFDEGKSDLPLAEAINARRMEVVLYLLEKGANFSNVIYKEVDGKEVFILEALRKCIFDLNSNQYIYKLKVISFLKNKGLNYYEEPIPEYILEKIKIKYPHDWQNFIKNY